tara:strand:+ start:2997 stop:5051 length:2055 start_codon:yes stop_codon:yes gene_type:complete
MSLVITSNNVNEQDEFDRGALDQAPFRYRNHLVSPLELPPNCEVAVQSVKINKNGLIRVSPADKFFIYFGKRITSSLDPDSESTASFPIMGSILPPGSDKAIYVNMTRFTEMLQDAVLLAIPHPDLDRTNTKVTQLFDGGATATNFSGFKFEFAYQNGVGNGLYDSSGAPSEIGFATKDDWRILNTQLNSARAPAMDITLDSSDNNKMKIEAVNNAGVNGLNVCWLNKRPLSHMNGVFEVDLTDLKEGGTEKLNGGFAIGLVRGTSVKTGQMSTFDGVGGELTNSRHFYDYVVYSEQINGAGDFFLRVGHCIYNSDDSTRKAGRPFVLEEIVYYDDGDGTSFATNTPWQAGQLVQSGTNGYNLSRNFGKMDKLIFKIHNERIHIEAQSVHGTGHGGTWDNAIKRITSFNAVSGHMKNKNIPKPIGTSCWNLFPKIMIRRSGRAVKIDKYDGREMSLGGVEMEADNPNGSWFVRMQGDEANGRLAMAFDSRDIYRLGDNPTATPTYTPLSTTNPTDPAGVLNDYRFILLLGSGEPFYRYTGSANLQSRLGFQGKGIIGNGSSSDSQTQNHSSPDAPDLMDYSSAFVRLDNFTQRSFNSGTGRPSKILYQVPRFDTSNREFGNALYYEPQERTYIKLQNSDPLRLNEIHMSICDNLERLCDAGITGKTVVCLHFRESSTPLFKLIK